MALIYHFGKKEDGGHGLSWDLDGSRVKVDFEDCVHAAVFSKTHKLVLVLIVDEGKDNPKYLLGFKPDGKKTFKVGPPEGYSFYYLASHLHHETAVVCCSNGHGLDWYFSIDPKTGELGSLNRAY